MTAITTSHGRLPDYENPPVNEVVVGLSFQPLVALRVPHLGLIWQRFRNEFPITEHATPLGLEQSLANLPPGAWIFVPRAWFINKDEDRLIQLQHDRFYVNWRSRADGRPYPRYATMWRLFKEKLAIVSEVLEQENIGAIVPRQYELKYVNHIVKGSGWTEFANVLDIFPDMAWRSTSGRFLPPPISGVCSAVFQLPDDSGRLTIRVQPGVRTIKDKDAKELKEDIIMLDLTAVGPANPDKQSEKDWFDMAHEWIVHGFADVTSTTIQRDFWKRKSGNG